VKLPEFQTGPTQSVRGIEEARDALIQLGHNQERAWQAGGQVASTVGSWGLEMARSQSQVQHAEALATLAEADAKATRENAQKVMYSTKEVEDLYPEGVPDDVKQRVGGLYRQQGEPETGEMTQVERNDIPAWAINPERYKKKMDLAVKEAGDRISLPGWKDSFVREASKQVAVEYQKHVAVAQKEMTDWKNAKLDNTAIKLANSGNFDAAKGIVKLMDLPEPKREELLQKYDRAQSFYQVNKPQTEQDLVGMSNIIEGLKSNEPKFAYTNGKGEVQNVDVTNLSEQERRGLVKEMSSNLRVLQNVDERQAKKEQQARNWSYESQFLDAYTRGDMNTAKRLVTQPLPGVDPGLCKQLIGMLESANRPVKSQTEKDESNLAVSTLRDVFDEAARGEAPSVKNPWTGEIMDPDDIPINDFATKFHIPIAEVKKWKEIQQAHRDGEPIEPVRADVKEAAAYVTDTLGYKPTDKNVNSLMVKASIKNAFLQDLRSYEKQHGGKLKSTEIREFATEWAANRQTSKTVSTWGGLSSDTVPESHTPLSDVPPSWIPQIQRVRSQYATKYPQLTAGNLDAIWDDHLKPVVDVFDDAWKATKNSEQVPTAKEKIETSAFVDLHRDELAGWLRTTYPQKFRNRKPTDTELLQAVWLKQNKLKENPFASR